MLRRLIAILLCIGLLSSGAAFAEAIPEPARTRTPVRFSDLVYERPDAEAVRGAVGALTARIAECEGIGDVYLLMDEAEAIFDAFVTMYSLAGLRASLDRRDADRVAEEKALAIAAPSVERVFFDFVHALAESPFRADIEREAPHFFAYLPNMTYLTDETVPLFEREAELICDYQEQLATAIVTYWGRDYTYNDFIANQTDYMILYPMGLWYETHGPGFMDRYIELVLLRMEIAGILGYESYTDLAFVMWNADYTVSDILDFSGRVLAELVPIVQSLGATAPTPDVDMSFTRFRPRFRRVLAKMGEDIAEAYDTMAEYDMYDVEKTSGKDPGAYTTFFPTIGLPFLFTNFTGDGNSVNTFSHEFGHVYAMLQTNGLGSYNRAPSMDVAETFSQAFELFMTGHYEEIFDRRIAGRLTKMLMSRMVSVIISTMYSTEIEVEVYAMSPDELTADGLAWMGKSLAADYGMSIDGFGGLMDSMLQYDWIMQGQVFGAPFYSMAYATSATVALELWEASLLDEAAALDRYRALILDDDGGGFLETLNTAGLKSPFGPDRIAEIRALVELHVFGEKYEVNMAGWN